MTDQIGVYDWSLYRVRKCGWSGGRGHVHVRREKRQLRSGTELTERTELHRFTSNDGLTAQFTRQLRTLQRICVLSVRLRGTIDFLTCYLS
jgi:hypothetical protein